MPPLRERKGDLRPLAQHFLDKYCREMGKKISKILFNPLEVADQLYMPDSSGGIEGMPIVPDRPGMFFWRIIGQ